MWTLHGIWTPAECVEMNRCVLFWPLKAILANTNAKHHSCVRNTGEGVREVRCSLRDGRAAGAAGRLRRCVPLCFHLLNTLAVAVLSLRFGVFIDEEQQSMGKDS